MVTRTATVEAGRVVQLQLQLQRGVASRREVVCGVLRLGWLAWLAMTLLLSSCQSILG